MNGGGLGFYVFKNYQEIVIKTTCQSRKTNTKHLPSKAYFTKSYNLGSLYQEAL